MTEPSNVNAILCIANQIADPEQREEYLQVACRNKPELRLQIQSLLAATALHSNPAATGSGATPNDRVDDITVDLKDDALIGQIMGHYRVLCQIGSGGMGRVYLAEDPRLDRKVALKVIAPGSVDDMHPRFIREARLASVLDHPNICAIHDVGESSGRHYIAMQYIPGKTLKEMIDEQPGGLPLESLLLIALQIAEALTVSHQHGIVHRDIKPGNVIVTPNQLTKVLDFGLAKRLSAPSDASRTQGVVGTPAYMSPEQARGEEVDGRSDIFSFGVVLYQMLTGALPFSGPSPVQIMSSIIARPHRPPRELRPDTPSELAVVIDRALAKLPGERYQSAADMALDLRAVQSALSTRSSTTHVKPATRRRSFALAMIPTLVLVAFAGWSARQEWSKWQAGKQLTSIESLAQQGDFFAAYDLAIAVRKLLPHEPRLVQLMPSISDTLSVTSEPEGAQVYLTRFVPEDKGLASKAVEIGTTPFTNLEVARGDYILRVEREGYAAFDRTISGMAIGGLEAPLRSPPMQIDVQLTETSKAEPGMVLIPGGKYRLVGWRRLTDAQVQLDAYFIDKFEVNNQDYQEFVNAGGYLKRNYWAKSFANDGRGIAWNEAMKKLVDRTGLPGPRAWANQTFPEGKADHPVTGITWYEAAAYASFRGKNLPTMFQWEKAARNGSSHALGLVFPWGLSRGSTMRRANFHSDGTIPVGSLPFGMSPYGCYEMAGNVAEWCLNETPSGFVVGGGSWGGVEYEFGNFGPLPAFQASDRTGFRCVLNKPGSGDDQGGMTVPVGEELPEYEHADEDEVKSWFRHYEPGQTPLEAQVVERQESQAWWRETVEYNGSEAERVTAYLYLPKNVTEPFQLIHFVPGGDVRSGFRTLPQSVEVVQGGVIRAGRAIFTVALKREPPGSVMLDPSSIEFVEAEAKRLIALRRGLNYLETRSELDLSRMAFMQASAGSMLMVLPAIEPRYRGVILWGAQLGPSQSGRGREASPVHFAPLIKVPKLLIHGRYDETTPLRTRAEPLFNLLPEPKRIVLFEGGHVPPPEVFIPTVNAWLDETLGVVARR